MSIEIEENYTDLRGFYYLLSLNYDKFISLSKRWETKVDLKSIYNRIQEMSKQVIRSKGTIIRIYNPSINSLDKEGGRLFGSTSIQMAPREIRGLLMKHTTDIDMKNAHPKILLYLCKAYGFHSPNLEYYVNNRDNILKEFIDKNTGKVTYLKALNKNSISKDIMYFPEKQRNALLDFSKEMTILQKQFMQIPEFNNLKESVEYRKYNKEGSFINKCICIIENNILNEMKAYLMENGYVIRCLAFDGLMIDGDCYKNLELLKKIEERINTRFENLNMELDYKEHDGTIQIPPEFKIDDKIFKEEDPYNIWKIEFEKTHSKIINKSIFIKCIKDDNEIIQEFKTFSKKDLITSYEHIKVKKEKYNEKTNEMDYESIECIKRWIQDENMKTYDDMDIFPPPLLCPANKINLWSPYYVQQIKKSTIEENEDLLNKEKVDMILELIKILCNNDEKDTLFLMKFIGQFLKYPAIKTYCITLISEQGAGKGTLMYMIERLIGEQKFLESTDPERDVWSTFNSLMENAIIVNCDELDAKSQEKCEGKIKGLITNKNLTINPKGLKPYKINSYHRFIFTTNKPIPLNTHKNDRRNKIIRCSDILCSNKNFFDKIRTYLNEDIILRLLYERFIELDGLDTFHLQGIDHNEYQKILTESSITVPEQFLENLTSRLLFEHETELTPEQILEAFVNFKHKCGIKYECNSTKLVQSLKLLKIPNWFTIHRTNVSRNLIINIDVLREHFSSRM